MIAKFSIAAVLASSLLPFVSAHTKWNWEIENQPEKGWDKVFFPFNISSTPRGTNTYLQQTFTKMGPHGEKSYIKLYVEEDHEYLGVVNAEFWTEVPGSTSANHKHCKELLEPAPHGPFDDLKLELIQEKHLTAIERDPSNLILSSSPMHSNNYGVQCRFRLEVNVHCPINIEVSRVGNSQKWVAILHADGTKYPMGNIIFPSGVEGINKMGTGYIGNAEKTDCDDLPYFEAEVFPPVVLGQCGAKMTNVVDNQNCKGIVYDTAEHGGYRVYQGNHHCNGKDGCN